MVQQQQQQQQQQHMLHQIKTPQFCNDFSLQRQVLNPSVIGKIQDFFKAIECFSSTFQGIFNFQGLFKTVLYIQVLFKPVQTLVHNQQLVGKTTNTSK